MNTISKNSYTPMYTYRSVNTKFPLLFYNSYAINMGILSYYYLKSSVCPELLCLFSSIYICISVEFPRETL